MHTHCNVSIDTPHSKDSVSHHHDHNRKITTLSTAFIVGTILNLAFVIIEGTAGFLSNSVSLLSDAGHNLSDSVSLLLAWIAYIMTQKIANKRFTYGYSKSTIMASLINACILLIAIGMIVYGSIRKFAHPQPVNETVIIWVAAVGIVINFITALFFLKDRKKDLNIKGAFLHMLMDALVSVGVVVSGILIKVTGYSIIDPILGLVIAFIIFISTWNLLKESLRLSLDAVPASIDIDKIEQTILKIPGVSAIHHIHIWALGTSENAITVHIAVSKIEDSENIKEEIRKLLIKSNISHATIETEPQDYQCCETQCEHCKQLIK